MRSRSALLLGSLLLALAGGCTARPSASDASSAPGLLPSVQATTYGDSVGFVLQVTNTTQEAVELEFRSGQSFDFVVERGGEEVWRWSDGQAFTQALRRQTLEAGETLTYTASWAPPSGLSGELVVRGVLTASGSRVEQAARFRIP